ncbi:MULTISPECIES: hypothetical protein [Polynucleobacter]|jgi:hypothetical protein|uniref:hypothetical protein n=1 Tax=Polynucleobacter TaxID=44013 RepID=UPI0008F80BE9|nr:MULTISPECIES: hypothetical protein [Polynucleobacter]MBT8573806.1 hypothetical protein [Polynucleobacter paneuropaeus]MBU3605798.1 hypothetical protein [Polynucleobacter sp. MWH-Creno-3A4]QWD77968.1 hypothetical protein C2757_08845 [Polynucleobacter sp. MWH-Svant-W18]
MRLMSIATLIFLFNTAFMPVFGMAHEQSHQAQEGVVQIAWNDDQSSNGLFQIAHDDHQVQAGSSDLDEHSSDHQCHHISVIGMVSFEGGQVVIHSSGHIFSEPIFLIQSFPAFIEYPPRSA